MLEIENEGEGAGAALTFVLEFKCQYFHKVFVFVRSEKCSYFALCS